MYCNTIQHDTTQHNTIYYSTIHCNTLSSAAALQCLRHVGEQGLSRHLRSAAYAQGAVCHPDIPWHETSRTLWKTRWRAPRQRLGLGQLVAPPGTPETAGRRSKGIQCCGRTPWRSGPTSQRTGNALRSTRRTASASTPSTPTSRSSRRSSTGSSRRSRMPRPTRGNSRSACSRPALKRSPRVEVNQRRAALVRLRPAHAERTAPPQARERLENM